MSFDSELSLNQAIKDFQDSTNPYTPQGRADFEAWQAISDYLAQFLTL